MANNQVRRSNENDKQPSDQPHHSMATRRNNGSGDWAGDRPAAHGDRGAGAGWAKAAEVSNAAIKEARHLPHERRLL
jgi:hypothetical protein